MIIGIGGEPATGKSTLMRELLKRFLLPGVAFKAGLVSGTMHWSHNGLSVAVLGRYDEEDRFPGTDRLSMAASPAVIEWLDSPGRAKIVLFEGDRLFTRKFIDACGARTEPCRFFMLHTAATELTRRHEERKDTQTAAFLKGRITKYKNLFYAPHVEHIDNTSPLQTPLWVPLIGQAAGFA